MVWSPGGIPDVLPGITFHSEARTHLRIIFWYTFAFILRSDYRHLEKLDNALAVKPVLKSGSEKMLRIFIMKDRATIVGAVVYIAVNVKHTNFYIYG